MGFKRIKVTALTIAFCFAVSITAIAQTVETQNVQPAQFDYSRLVVALEQSGTPYQKIGSNRWSMAINNEEETRQVSIVTNRDIVSLLQGIAPSPEETPDGLKKKLLDLNNRYYFVKFIDDGTNIYARIDVLLGSLNGAVIANLASRLVMSTDAEIEGLKEMLPAE